MQDKRPEEQSMAKHLQSILASDIMVLLML